jgi:hypothetical protein
VRWVGWDGASADRGLCVCVSGVPGVAGHRISDEGFPDYSAFSTRASEKCKNRTIFDDFHTFSHSPHTCVFSPQKRPFWKGRLGEEPLIHSLLHPPTRFRSFCVLYIHSCPGPELEGWAGRPARAGAHGAGASHTTFGDAATGPRTASRPFQRLQHCPMAIDTPESRRCGALALRSASCWLSVTLL